MQSIKKVIMNILYRGLQVSKCVKMAATENEDKYLIFFNSFLVGGLHVSEANPF